MCMQRDKTMQDWHDEGWVQTDASCNQYYKEINDHTFLFREDRVVNGDTFETEPYSEEIDIHDYDLDDYLKYCEPFGYDREEIVQWVLDGDNNALIAECIFEFS